MNPIDMRSLSAAERRRRRVRVMALRAAGGSLAAIAAQTGLSRTGVFDICKRVAAQGAKALDDAPPAARGGRLGPARAAVLRALIAGHTPEQLSLPARLWTHALAARLIEQRTGLRLSVRNTALTLARWGFVPPRPLAKARLRSPTAAARWLADDYPAVLARARSEGAEIGWLDESRLQEPPRGEARTVFSTVDNRGRMRWSTFAGSLDAATFIELLRRRLHQADRKIVLILDPLRVHRSARVRAWLGEHEDEIELVHLPGRADRSFPG
ncbi:MAG: transposase [Burkholderiales bacterium]|nr:transposase [Burkholderiales bacterium]